VARRVRCWFSVDPMPAVDWGININGLTSFAKGRIGLRAARRQGPILNLDQAIDDDQRDRGRGCDYRDDVWC
jgi:hypothetical protein